MEKSNVQKNSDQMEISQIKLQFVNLRLERVFKQIN